MPPSNRRQPQGRSALAALLLGLCLVGCGTSRHSSQQATALETELEQAQQLEQEQESREIICEELEIELPTSAADSLIKTGRTVLRRRRSLESRRRGQEHSQQTARLGQELEQRSSERRALWPGLGPGIVVGILLSLTLLYLTHKYHKRL